jgi:hypothetical protein
VAQIEEAVRVCDQPPLAANELKVIEDILAGK